MKTHDWRPVSGLVHPYPEPAQEEVEKCQVARPGLSTRVKYVHHGYQAQVRVPRSPKQQSLSLAQAARELGLASSTLRWQIRNGALTASKIGSYYVVDRSEVDRYRLENKR